MYTIRNETPYDIRYVTLQNVIREIAVISFLLELDFNPFTAWWAIPKTIESFSAVSKAVSYFFRVLVDRGFDHNEEDFLLIRTGSIAPGETKTWFEGGLQTCEGLLQVATFTDQEDRTTFLGFNGMSLSVMPSLDNYCSKMDGVRFLSGASAVDWGSVEIGWIKKIIEVLDKINEIIKKIHEVQNYDVSCQNDHQHGNIAYLQRISYQTNDSLNLIHDFKLWCNKEGILKDLDDNTAEYIDNLRRKWFQTDPVNASEDFSFRASDIIAMTNEVKILQQRFEKKHSNRFVSEMHELLQHTKWTGLPFFVKVPTPTFVPVKRKGQPNPPCPFLKAIDKEIDSSKPANAYGLWGRGATLFLEMAVTKGAPINSSTFFKSEAIHVHLPSLKDSSGKACPKGFGFSYWIMKQQPNNLSNAGWCVNVEYNGSKYQLVNEKHIACVDLNNKIYTDGTSALVELGRKNQVLLSWLCCEPISSSQALMKQFFINVEATLFRESMSEAPSDYDEETKSTNTAGR